MKRDSDIMLDMLPGFIAEAFRGFYEDGTVHQIAPEQFQEESRQIALLAFMGGLDASTIIPREIIEEMNSIIAATQEPK